MCVLDTFPQRLSTELALHGVMHEDVWREGVRRRPSIREQSHGGRKETELKGSGRPEPGSLDYDRAGSLLIQVLTVSPRGFRLYSIGALDHWLMTQGRKESDEGFVG